jgi:hypothetical protein
MQRCDLGPDPENALRRDRSFMGIGPGRGDRCGGRIARASLGKAGPPVVRCLAGGLGKSMIRTGSRRSYCGSTYGRAGIGHVRGSLRCAKSHRTSASIYVVLYPSSLVRLPSDRCSTAAVSRRLRTLHQPSFEPQRRRSRVGEGGRRARPVGPGWLGLDRTRCGARHPPGYRRGHPGQGLRTVQHRQRHQRSRCRGPHQAGKHDHGTAGGLRQMNDKQRPARQHRDPMRRRGGYLLSSSANRSAQYEAAVLLRGYPASSP